jgi:hypothetical protein
LETKRVNRWDEKYCLSIIRVKLPGLH